MRRSILMLSAIALIAIGCAGQNLPSPSSSSSALPSSSAPGEVLDFTSTRVGGGQFQGNELKGKDVALWFYAPW